MRFDRLGVGLGFALALFADPALALGRNDCSTDADCPAGLGCAESAYTICEGWSSGGGGEGGRVEEYDCQDYVDYVCVPKACTTDAECGGGTSCVEFSYVACSGGGSTGGAGGEPDTGGGRGGDSGTGTGGAGGAGAAGGAGGGAAGGSGGLPPEECVTVTESWCVPPWIAPCEQDADCGPGFLCVADEICTSTPDGDGAGAAGGGVDCEPSDAKRCELVETTCATSADCAAGLECQTFSEWSCEYPEEPPPPPGEGGAGGSAGGSGGAAGGAGGSGGRVDDGGGAGGTPADPCEEQTRSLCVPPGFVAWMGAYGPGYGEDGGYGGRGPTEGAGGSSAPADGDAGASPGDADAGPLGCQTGGGGLSLLALLGVALLLRRR